MKEKSKKKSETHLKKEALLKIKKKPESLSEVSKGDNVLLLTGILFTKEKDRIGYVIDFKDNIIIMKFPKEEVHSQLRFYGNTWGLLENE